MNLTEKDITPEELFLNRRDIIKAGSLMAALGLAQVYNLPYAWAVKKNSLYAVNDKDRSLTKEDLATSYNNFYEFSLDKGEVRKKVDAWKIQKPWKIEISGLKDGKTKTFDLEEMIKMAGGTEERIYRFRCVEAWSMVIPWIGFSLAEFIKKLDINPKAKYVRFESFGDEKVWPEMKKLPYYPWPYTEGLTLEEAMNPLTLLATGMYGKDMPKQNGAPVRLVVPWKYGFKNIKSIVKIEFTETKPVGLWEKLAPNEYGFYANVNPNVDHPRWSQSSERVIDGKFFPTKIPTLMYNGYEKEVAYLYKGLDLNKNF